MASFQPPEQDIAHASDNDNEFVQFSRWKGKAKEQLDLPSPAASSEQLDDIAYPPVSEDAEETRRIEENLRRWEIAERQRRKAARISSAHSPSPSLVGDVSQRASLLWTGRKGRITSVGVSHTALPSQDTIDVVPLNQIATSQTPSPTCSISQDSHNPHSSDPFANLSESLSPFSDAHQIEDFQIPVSLLNQDVLAQPGRPPIPKPLNLPPPRTPPPVAMPLSPVDANKFETTETSRWWHDWLCGCGEGPDRGGDFQAGRTNPFE